MNYTLNHKEKEQQDRRKSAIITAVVSLAVFLVIFLYKFTRIVPQEEVVTTMLINFGDNQNGNQTEEPANQEGSLATNAEIEIPEPVSEPNVNPKPTVHERIISGNNAKISAPKPEKVEKNLKNTTKSTTNKTSTTKKSNNTAAKAQGDGKGTAAIGNLIRGRGNNSGNQGNAGTNGNAGDPLGGDGNGDSKIGVDRKLIGFIPGTMGRGGSQPNHNCSASGTINISYTVDKAGNVISARRSSGVSDACVVSTTVSWVKQFVKAEKGNTSSTGVYKITF